MRINLADVLAILTTLAICVGTAIGIDLSLPKKSISILPIIAGALIMLLVGLRQRKTDSPDQLPDSPRGSESTWPVGTYLISGLIAFLTALLAIRFGAVLEVWLGMACGWAIGATLARHREAPSIAEEE